MKQITRKDVKVIEIDPMQGHDVGLVFLKEGEMPWQGFGVHMSVEEAKELIAIINRQIHRAEAAG